MRLVAIIGSRTTNKDDYMRVGRLVGAEFKNLSQTNDIIVSGGAPTGADHWARKYCNQHGFRYLEAVAFWSRQVADQTYPGLVTDYGAGKFRNLTIAKVSDLCIAFWNGTSRGTKHCIDAFEKLGKEVMVVKL